MTPDLYYGGQNHKDRGLPLLFGTLKDTELAVDWLSVTFPDVTVNPVRECLLDLSLGEAPRGGKGMHGWRFAEVYSSGCQLHYSRKGDDLAWLQVNGGACGVLGPDNLRRLAHVAGHGGKCSRIDIRLDFRGEDLSLVQLIIEACQAGHLRSVKRFEPHKSTSSDLEVLGDGVTLGSRSSARFVRVYDKGLETGTLPRGQWIRFEVELKDWAAHEAFCALFDPTAPDQFRSRALARILAAVDFRVGPRDVEPSRLPRPGWWEQIVSGVDLARPPVPSSPPDLDRWAEALCVQYGSLIHAAAKSLGLAPGVAFEALTKAVRVNRGTLDNPNLPLLTSFLSSACVDQ